MKQSRWLFLLLCGLTPWTLLAGGEAVWSEDYAGSVERAKNEDKPILLLFTGSDWCPPCKAMESRVFASEEFGAYASEHLVLVKADFPRRRALEASVKQQNDELAKNFGVEYFPTILVLSPGGKVLGQTVGAQLNTPETFLEMVREATTES